MTRPPGDPPSGEPELALTPARLEELLDEAAARVFGGPAGPERLAPLLARWGEEVGTIREDDQDRELLQAMRTDWALCDAPAVGERPWLAILLEGGLGPVPDRWRVLSRSHIGLFEVFPGKVSWLRDLRGGLCVPVLDPLPLVPEASGPAAVWEARVVLAGGTATLARGPLGYPFELLPTFVKLSQARFGAPEPKLRWAALRRGWLQFSRARRADARNLFRL
ncbi:MAG: hypothetical protein ACRBN8_16830 [Nannocystales bacterium]